MICLMCGLPMARNNRAGHPPGTRLHDGRGLCEACHDRAIRRGVLMDFERRSRPVDEVVEDWLMLREQGHDRRRAAERMGITHHALEQALLRAVRRGLITEREGQSFAWLERRTA